jgi:hypothetical protein
MHEPIIIRRVCWRFAAILEALVVCPSPREVDFPRQIAHFAGSKRAYRQLFLVCCAAIPSNVCLLPATLRDR